jgi:hypothetical protein
VFTDTRIIPYLVVKRQSFQTKPLGILLTKFADLLFLSHKYVMLKTTITGNKSVEQIDVYGKEGDYG